MNDLVAWLTSRQWLILSNTGATITALAPAGIVWTFTGTPTTVETGKATYAIPISA